MADGTATPKSKIDQLSKEDLIKFVKKQVAALKIAKEQCVEQQEKIAKLEQELKTSKPAVVSLNVVDSETQTAVEDHSHEEILKNREEEFAVVNQQLRHQILVLRTALNRRRFEIEDLRAASDKFSSSSSPPDDGDAAAMEESSLKIERAIEAKTETIDVFVQTLNDAGEDVEKIKRENAELTRQLDEALQFQKKKGADDSSLLALEIEDYERAVQKLQSDFAVQTSELSLKISENQTLREDMKRVREMFNDAEKNVDATRASLKTTEKELEDAKIQLREKIDEAHEASEKWRNVELQLSEAKLELSGVWSNHQQSTASLQENVADLKRKFAESQQECARLKRTLSEVSTEYETYKVRAHSIFKQKRTESTDGAGLHEEKRLFDEKTVVSLQEQLAKANSLYQSTLEELRRSQEQYDQAATKHKERETRFEQTTDSLRKQINELRYEANVQKQTHDEFIQRTSAVQTQMKSDFEKQVRILSEENAEKVSDLRLQIYRLEEALRESRSVRGVTKETAASLDADLRPPPIDERKPAEGSENADYKPAPLTIDVNRLSSPNPMDTPLLDDVLNFDQQSDAGTISVADYSALEMKVEDATKRLRNLVEVLAESESNNTRMNEQVRLLKDEIRRLERNQEREKHVANAEYLKNVIMKFVNPNSKDKRASLVPVLATLLRLSAEEIKLLEELSSEGGVQNAPAPGWSGYLHRWSGFT